MAARVSPDGMDIEKVIIIHFKAKKNNFKHYSDKIQQMTITAVCKAELRHSTSYLL